ncbi:MAG TPA: hypothetical protein VIJ82_00235 [Streptosporangiaceae bacterium]|jgi:hypothetical protein
MTVTGESALAKSSLAKSGPLTEGGGARQPAARWPAAQQAPQPAVASCWLCGVRLSTALMVADGGPACQDVRWYCQDTQHCTWRWTTKSGPAAGPRHPRHPQHPGG